MNPRQRRGVLLIGLAVIGALAVFVSVVNYVSDVQSQVGPMVTILQLSADAEPYAEITPDMVVAVDRPERWSPPNALTDAVELAGRVPTVALPAGTELQSGMLVDPPMLQPGEREIAIMVDAETGVAGKIGRGSVVDIVATFPEAEGVLPQSNIVIEAARILDVGLTAPTAEATATGGFSEGQAVPVTFALTSEQMLRVAYIESFAANVRLALRAPLDSGTVGATQRTYRPDLGSVGQPGVQAPPNTPPTAAPVAPAPAPPPPAPAPPAPNAGG
jgi:pilus assembly protein CpaB